jgi:hypothetical protein
MKTQIRILAAVALAMCVLGRYEALGGGLLSVEGGIPLEIEDAFPSPYLNREVQGVGRYARTADGEDEWLLEGRFEYGFARNWEASLHVPFAFGSGARDEGIQDVGLEALYNFNMESRYLPAFSLAGGVAFPTASDSRGVDTELKFLTTRSFGCGERLQRVHLNLSWLRNAGAREDEREDRFKAVVGYDIRLGPDTLLLADYVWEQEVERGVTSQIAEIGVRQMVHPLTAIGAGIGFGLDSESPDVRATLGFQRTF